MSAIMIGSTKRESWRMVRQYSDEYTERQSDLALENLSS